VLLEINAARAFVNRKRKDCALKIADTSAENARIRSGEQHGGIGSVKIPGLLFAKAVESSRSGDRYDGSMT
jgi:hypothetical protein